MDIEACVDGISRAAKILLGFHGVSNAKKVATESCVRKRSVWFLHFQSIPKCIAQITIL